MASNSSGQKSESLFIVMIYFGIPSGGREYPNGVDLVTGMGLLNDPQGK